MRLRHAVVAGCLLATPSCGDGEGIKEPEREEAGVETGMPNACELFTEADTTRYGGLGVGLHTTSGVADACIYTATIDDELRQISVLVGAEAAFVPSVMTLDTLYRGTVRSGVDYGEQAYLYLDDGRGALAVLLSRVYLQVDVRLRDPEPALRAIVEQVLTRL